MSAHAFASSPRQGPVPPGVRDGALTCRRVVSKPTLLLGGAGQQLVLHAQHPMSSTQRLLHPLQTRPMLTLMVCSLPAREDLVPMCSNSVGCRMTRVSYPKRVPRRPCGGRGPRLCAGHSPCTLPAPRNSARESPPAAPGKKTSGQEEAASNQQQPHGHSTENPNIAPRPRTHAK